MGLDIKLQATYEASVECDTKGCPEMEFADPETETIEGFLNRILVSEWTVKCKDGWDFRYCPKCSSKGRGKK